MVDWKLLELFELLSYAATIVGIPLAIWVFMHEEKKGRQSEQEEIYDKLMDHYDHILGRLFEHPDIDQHHRPLEDAELKRQQKLLYEMLINLFERAFILLYGEKELAYRRMWNSWEDYIKVWIGRPNFVEMLPDLMKGEDSDFVAYMARLSERELTP
ncbi:MAG: hypothetical protein WBK55_09975 [Alphaproteobacteria bacterium]